MMVTYIPSFPYPPASSGVWSPATSTINWCEEDYYASIYCAEIINAFTNLAFVHLAYKGLSSCVRNNHDTAFLVGFVSYLVIGLASFIFHSTLKYSTQLFDELAMIYTTCVMFYAAFSYQRATIARALIACLVVFIALFITLYYHYLKDPLFHQNMFALLTAIVFFRSAFIMETTLRPSRRAQTSKTPLKVGLAEKTRVDQRDLAILKTMWQMIPIGLGSVAIGFLIWNLDNAFCPTFRQWRRAVGLPWGILLEGHGWWHIFSGIAQYFNLTWSIWLRHCLSGNQDKVELIWPSVLTSMPTVERVQEVNTSPAYLDVDRVKKA